MYTIERQLADLHLVFAGAIGREDMDRWRAELGRALERVSAPFGALVDLRDLSPLREDVGHILCQGQADAQARGLLRSAVIVRSAYFATPFKMLSLGAGTYTHQRYLDASVINDCDEVGWAWVRGGVEPPEQRK